MRLNLARIAFFLIGLVVVSSSSQLRAAFPNVLPAYAQPRALREDATLRAVAFRSDQIGIACGDRGTILRTEDGGKSWEIVESGLDTSLTGVQWVSGDRVVAVGGALDRVTGLSRGVVLMSDNAGRTWKRASDEELPRLVSIKEADGTLLAHGDWSDSLLTNRFESHDRGRTWHAGVAEVDPPGGPPSAAELIRWVNATKIPIAVRHACRVSEAALCAVGDHGVIMVSKDGGRSWTATRGAGRQTAILMVAQDAETVAWSLMGSETLESRGRLALLLDDTSSVARDNSDRSSSPWDSSKNAKRARTLQAAVAMGAAGVDEIRSSDADLATMASQWIAIHRPAVLAIDRSLRDELSDAFLQAATAAGVQRVVMYDFGGRGDTMLHRDALLTKTGVLASDLQSDALHWVSPFHREDSSIQLKYLYDAVSGVRRDSMLSGMSLSDGYRLTAVGPSPSRRKLQIAQARMNQPQRIAALIEKSRTVTQFTDSLQSMLDQTGRADQFRLAWSVVLDTSADDSNARSIAFHEAALQLFATRYSTLSAGRWAALRQQVMRNSVEWQRLRASLADSPRSVAPLSVVEPVAVSPFQVGEGGVRQVSAVSPLLVPKPDLIDLNQPSQQAETQVDLHWEFHPMVLLAREASRQRSDHGTLQPATEQSSNLSRLADVDHEWSHLLQANSSTTIFAHPAAAPPRLDGRISDDCWKSAETLSGPLPHVRVAYDNDYVYIAVQCDADQISEDHLARQSSASLRDQDLDAVDRLRFEIDVDRDLMSAVQLQVSDAGRVHDAIDSHSSWQPTWYPAIHRDQETITFEIAILRRDLVELPITSGESWFMAAKVDSAGDAARSAALPSPQEWQRVLFRP